MESTGTKISQLDKIGYGQSTDGKIMLVLEPSDCGGSGYSNRYITFEDFRKCIHRDVDGYLGFGSMAYKDKEDYSKHDHDHDEKYNRLTVITNEEYSENDILATIRLDNLEYNIRSSVSSPDFTDDTEIGQIKFVYDSSTSAEIDIYGEGFDGWVYANGKTYETNSRDEFVDAKDTFITDSDNMRFTVPKLDNFIRPNLERMKYSDRYDTYVSSNSYSEIPLHTHSFKFTIGEDAKCDILTKTTKTTSVSGNYLTRGQNKVDEKESGISLSVQQFGIFNLSSEESGLQNGETYPSHNLVPAMIYIGRK